jgi:hypothetical protein
VTRVVLVPGVLALLPEYAGLTDPVADLRAACLRAVAWLGQDVRLVADPQGKRVAEHLLLATDRSGSDTSYLVVGNGSARRAEKAPGHYDERSLDFDTRLSIALKEPDRSALSNIDAVLARELWADTDAIAWLGEVLTPDVEVTVEYDDDPFGVQYWVMRWES